MTCVIKSPVISARKKMTSRKQGVRNREHPACLSESYFHRIFCMCRLNLLSV
nr:MAG TPA: hypothetical protein [Caudoviricetes sp.]